MAKMNHSDTRDIANMAHIIKPSVKNAKSKRPRGNFSDTQVFGQSPNTPVSFRRKLISVLEPAQYDV